MLRDRVVDVLDADEIENRRKGLLLHGRVVVLRAHDRRLDVVAAAEIAGHFRATAAAQDLPALLDDVLQGGLHLFDRGGVDERSAQRALGGRIADLDARVGGEEALLDLGRDLLVDEQSPRGRAALSSRADRAEEDRRHRELEVGVVHEHDRVVAAELEDRPAEARRDRLRDLPSDGSRTGERHERHARILEHLVADFATRADAQRDQSAEAFGLEDGAQRIRHADRAQRGEARRLPQAGVAADEREHRVPRPDRDGEVERPSGCHCSRIACCARSECIERPYSMRD